MVEEIYRKGKDRKEKDQLIRRRILIGEKEIKLKFTMPIWIQMEEQICTLDDLYTMMHSQERFHEDKIPALIALMSGGDVTPKEVLRECDVATMRALIDEIGKVAAEAMQMKEKKYDDDSVHDEVLEEIEKKEPQAD